MTQLLLNLLQGLGVGLFLSYMVFIWFETHFVIEYFGWASFTKAKAWKEYEQTYPEGKYPYFLREKYPCWLTRLLGCPFCLIGFSTLLLTVPFIVWSSLWALLSVPFTASFGFLLLMFLYKNVYLKKN